MPWCEYLQSGTLDLIYGQQTFTPPATVYVGLLGAGTWAPNTAYSLGAYIISANFATTVRHIFIVTVAGTSGTSGPGPNGEPSWNQTAGATTVDGTVTWTECTNLFVAGTFTGAELSTSIGSYARIGLTNNTTNWPLAAGGPPRVKQNGVAVTFPTPTATWVQAVATILCTALTGVTIMEWQYMTLPIVAGSGSGPPIFGIGSIQTTVQ